MKLKGLIFAAVLTIVSAIPAAAQDGLGLGLSFLGDEGGTGFLVDYSKPFQSQATSHRLGWVGEVSYFPGDFTTLIAQGGVRASGQAGTKLNWLLHGMVGIIHQSVDFDDDLVGDLCDELDIDCGFSNTSGVLTIGGGVEYALNEKNGIRGQLDIPIALTDGGGHTTRFSIVYVLRMK